MDRTSRLLRRSLAGIGLAVLAALSVPGCASWNPQGEGYGDETANWAQRMRTPTNKGELYGYDTRAQEIERNLGVR